MSAEETIAAAPLAAFGKKIGPLPGWAWVAIVVGAAYLLYFLRKRGAAGAGTPTSPTTAADAFAPAALGFESAGPAPGTGTYSGQVNTVPVGQAAVATNAQWAKAVGNYLIGTGSYDTSAVSNALSKYLNGGNLTSQESAIVGTAVKQFQLPPEGVLPVNTAPASAVPWVGHKYTAQAGDTLASILQRFYGRQSEIDSRLVQAINPGITSGPITAGTVVALPTTGVAGVQSNTLNTYDTPPPASVSLTDIGRPITIVSQNA